MDTPRRQDNRRQSFHPNLRAGSVARIVQKFGGTSVADIDRIINVANKVKAELDAGHQVAVVVSAMAGATNRLVEQCSAISNLFDAREYDVVVASGEQVTAGLTALALLAAGWAYRRGRGSAGRFRSAPTTYTPRRASSRSTRPNSSAG